MDCPVRDAFQQAGTDGKDYPIKCIRLLSTKEKLVYTIMKEDDTWCLVGEEFCKK
jgi:hypothetical protein